MAKQIWLLPYHEVRVIEKRTHVFWCSYWFPLHNPYKFQIPKTFSACSENPYTVTPSVPSSCWVMFSPTIRCCFCVECLRNINEWIHSQEQHYDRIGWVSPVCLATRSQLHLNWCWSDRSEVSCLFASETSLQTNSRLHFFMSTDMEKEVNSCHRL